MSLVPASFLFICSELFVQVQVKGGCTWTVNDGSCDLRSWQFLMCGHALD
jgi:hypothetical protein